MSDFEKWFKSLNENGRVTYFLGQEGRISEEAWNHQQAIIDEHTEVIKLQDADLRKYEKQIESLKAQLNNMEACYIEKKKEVEELQKTNISLEAGLRKNSKNKQKLLGKNIELQKRIDEYKKLTTSIRNEFDLWSDDSEFADVIEAQIENLEALRGVND
ncbi:hypothetical protein [Acinetobacter sp. YH12100]|uniref:hypothetical protein n=1 Tax=Acinetobacter sp. YH12100 TaxID=2601089 RepID=UPI00211E678E|nr:hypothetical protein [Acinetobacter sp. YH12100]